VVGDRFLDHVPGGQTIAWTLLFADSREAFRDRVPLDHIAGFSRVARRL
jgi:hypothetical protein